MEKLKLSLDKNTLLDLYCNKWLSAIDIAKKYGISSTAVYHLMNKYEIKRRDNSEAKLLGKKKAKQRRTQKIICC